MDYHLFHRLPRLLYHSSFLGYHKHSSFADNHAHISCLPALQPAPSAAVQFTAVSSNLRRRCNEYRIQRAVFTLNLVYTKFHVIDRILVKTVQLSAVTPCSLTSAGCHIWCSVYRGEIQHYSTTRPQTLNTAPYTIYKTTPNRAQIKTNPLTIPLVQKHKLLCLQKRRGFNVLVCEKTRRIKPHHPNILYIVVNVHIQ